MINYALPGTIVGIAYLIAFNDPPLALTGAALIIVACYVFRYSPTGIRATVALLQQIDRAWRRPRRSLGAGSATTFRRVTLPLIMPAFFAGLGVVFIRSMTAISATIFLVSISWTLITVRILENMTELSLGPAAAFSVFVIAVVMIVMAAPQRGSVGACRPPRASRCNGDRAEAARCRHVSARLQWALPVSPLAIRLDGVSRRFQHRVKGEVAAVHEVSPRGAAGRAAHPAGPVGLRQDHDPAHDRGLPGTDGGAHLDRRSGRHGIMANERGIGFVFQNYALFPHLTVFENVAYGLRVQRRAGVPHRERRRRGAGSWSALRVTSGSMPHQLSGGEQQRVALARAIVIQPRRAAVRRAALQSRRASCGCRCAERSARLQKRLGITTVYVTHDQEEAMAISDRIAVMDKGEIAQIGDAEELYRRPASVFVARFIGRANLLSASVTSVGPTGVEIEIAGQPLAVAEAHSELRPGQAVTAVIRPEALAISDAKTEEGLPGRVTSCAYLGDKCEYGVDIAGANLQVTKANPQPGDRLLPGTAVRLNLPATGIHLLPEG